jgi:hypothetical protein
VGLLDLDCRYQAKDHDLARFRLAENAFRVKDQYACPLVSLFIESKP